jgi:hypothetical protein
MGRTMDAATRAELDALRLRAYGPSADIASDPVALDRLVELEELALPGAIAVESRPPIDSVDAAAAPVDPRAVDVAASRRPRPPWHLALVAAVALVAVPLGVTAASRTVADAVPSGAAGQIPASVRDALAFANDPAAETLIRVRIDGSFGDYVDIEAGDDVPLFPVEGLMTWVEPLGDYYGWRLWIGGARGAIEDENCMLLDGDGTQRANCVSTELKSQGALLLSVPYAEVAPEERPVSMSPDQSLGFWWGPTGVVTILLSPTPAG